MIGTNDFNPLAVSVLSEIYNLFQKWLPGFQTGPFNVVYGTLSIDENRERGGSPRSKHLIGMAIDIQPTPNSDERKMVVASVAEYVIIKRRLGSEIAIEWGLNGHVHIGLLLTQGIHKRYSMDNGVVWTSKNADSVIALKKAIEKYGYNDYWV